MAKEVAIGKRAKITKAQQYILLAVFGSALFLGVGLALVSHFIQQISFNSKVIAAEEQAIDAYSGVIESIGVCEKPSGNVYSDSELEKCDPNSIEISQIPDSLRAKILEHLAANEALNSVPKENNSGCINSDGKAYTYQELNQIYQNAAGAEALQAASDLIKKCSALRVIPDALPAFRNEEALLSSLNKLFIFSNVEPESFSSTGSSSALEGADNLNILPISFYLEDTNTSLVTTVLHNIERSIRELDFNKIHLEWEGGNLNFQAEANAYYMNESSIDEVTRTITKEDN